MSYKTRGFTAVTLAIIGSLCIASGADAVWASSLGVALIFIGGYMLGLREGSN